MSRSKSKNKSPCASDPTYHGHENQTTRGKETERESIDMQVLTGRESSTISDVAASEAPIKGRHDRPSSPATTYTSLSAKGGPDEREVRRWSSSLSAHHSSKQGGEDAISRIQETHSAV